ncbi:MAG: hypothetical protein AAGA54_34640 [Myxococcota bacterium]
MLIASMGGVALAPATSSAATAQAQSYTVAVVKVSVREANGRVYRAKTRAIRMGDAASFDIVSDLHRHTVEVSADGDAAEVSYARDGGAVAQDSGTLTKRVRVFEQDGHRVSIEIVPTVVTVDVQ